MTRRYVAALFVAASFSVVPRPGIAQTGGGTSSCPGPVSCAAPGLPSEVRHTVRTDRYYALVSMGTGLALQIGPGFCAQLPGMAGQLGTLTFAENQKFRFVPVGDYNYRIIAKHSGHALSVMESTTAPEENRVVLQYIYVGRPSQKWELVGPQSASDGTLSVTLIPNGSQRTLTATRASASSPVVLSTRTAGNVQRWSLVPLPEAVSTEPSVTCSPIYF